MARKERNIRTGSFVPVLKASSSVAALVCAMSVAGGASAQTVIDSDPAELNNLVVIDAGAGNQAPGVIIIGEADGTTLDIENSGTIQGRGNAAAGLEAAGDGIRLERLRVDGSLVNPSTATFTGSLTNSGLIDSEGANGTVSGIRFVDGVSFQGTLDNEAGGTISGVQNGLYFGNAAPGGGGDHTGGVVSNSGTISSDSRALNIDGTGLVVNNSGTILATGTQRNGTVYADSTAQDFTLNNLADGVIDAGAGLEGAAFSVELSEAGNNFDINNDGLIQGRGQANAGVTAAGDGLRFERTRVDGALDASTVGLFTGNITNTGTIDSESAQGTAAGIRFVNGVSFSGTIDNSGTISGVQNGLYFGNAVTAGGGDFTGGVVNNSGTISSDSRALNIDGTGLVVNNSGSILGTGDQRNGTVYADATANNFVLNNLAGGVIDAGAGNAGSGISFQLGSVDGDTRTISVSNEGSVLGRGDALASGQTAGLRLFSSVNGVTVNGDISNAGSISSETAPAILIENVNYTGVITNTGDLTGSTAFDASAALGAVNFVQAGGSLNGDFVGSAFADSLSLTGGVVNGSILGNVATTVAEEVSVTFTGQQTLEGDLTSNGALNFVLGTDSLTVDGNTTFGAASIVNIETNDDISDLVLGAPISVISETGTFTNNGVTVNVNDDDFLVDYAVALGSVTVTANAVDLAGVSADQNVAAFGGALTAAFTANALDADIANALNDVDDAAGFETASLSLLPSINEGVTREIFESHSLADQFVNRRLRSDAPRGAWIQGLGRVADRDADSTSVSGYDADAFGVALGVDTNVNEEVTIGASFNYANISIDSDGIANETTDLDSFQVSAYAGYQSGAAFLNGQVGYVFGDGESTRTGVAGPIDSDFDVSGVTAQATAGYTVLENGAWSLTSNAGLRFASLSQSDFTEEGGLNLALSSDDVQYLDARIGADLEGNYGSIKPFVRVGYVYDIIGDERVFNADFAGADVPFALTTSEPAQSRFDVNTGFGVEAGNGVSINVEYDGEFASGYQSHGGFLRARVAF